MQKINTKKMGFTLIELLVVIVIIGILSTISTATFKSYFGKARDAERQAAVQNIALMIKVEGSSQWDNDKYFYNSLITNDPTATNFSLVDLFAENDFRVPKSSNAIYYFLGMSKGDNTQLGDDNGFVVATWGESTSTESTGDAGVLVDGTEAHVNAVIANFSGATTAAATTDKFSGTGTPFNGLTYDGDPDLAATGIELASSAYYRLGGDKAITTATGACSVPNGNCTIEGITLP